MSVTERIVSGAKAMLAAQLIRMASKGAVVVLLTRIFLDPGEYGLLFLAISILGVATLFASLGLAKSAARYVAEYRERDPGQIPHILLTTLKYNLVTIVVVGAVVVAFRDVIARLLGEPSVAPFLLVGVVYVAAVSLTTFSRLLFQGFGRVTYTGALTTVSSATVLVAVPGFLLLGTGPIGAMYGYALGASFAAFVGLWLLYTRFYRQYEAASEAEPGLARRILEYSVPLAATRGANILDKRVDTILVGYFMNPVAVGFYTLGKQVTAFANAPAASLGFAAAPAYGEHKTTGDPQRAADLYETTLEYTLTLYIPAAVGLFLVARPLVRVVFGSSYLGAVPVLQVFALYLLLAALDQITTDGLDYLGRARTRAYAKGGTSVANFLLNLVAIPRYGAAGAAGATVVTFSGLVAVELYLVAVELPIRWTDMARSALTIGGVAGGMGLVVVALLPYASTIPTLAAVIAAGLVAWAALGMVVGVLDPEELRTVLT